MSGLMLQVLAVKLPQPHPLLPVCQEAAGGPLAGGHGDPSAEDDFMLLNAELNSAAFYCRNITSKTQPASLLCFDHNR